MISNFEKDIERAYKKVNNNYEYENLFSNIYNFIYHSIQDSTSLDTKISLYIYEILSKVGLEDYIQNLNKIKKMIEEETEKSFFYY